MLVRLKDYELRAARWLGEYRQKDSLLKGHGDGAIVADDRSGASIHIEGAEGEMAFAKGMMLYWPMSVGVGQVPDVPPFHVRTTSHPAGGLFIKPKDPEGPYALVLKKEPDVFDIAGWCYSTEITDQPFNWTNKKGMKQWRVDASRLSPCTGWEQWNNLSRR